MLRTKVVDSFSFNFHSLLISSCQDVSVQVCCKTSLEKFNTFLLLSSYFSIYLSFSLSVFLYLYFSLSVSLPTVSLSSKITICFYSVSLFQYSNYLCNPLSVRISVSLICLTISLLLLSYFISISLSLFFTLLHFCYWFIWLFFLSVSRS